MFTPQKVLERLDETALEDITGIEQIAFEQWDYVVTGGEDTVIFHRAEKSNFRDFLDFYLTSLYGCAEYLHEEKINHEDFKELYISKAIYKPITKEDFLSRVSGYTSGLKEKFELKLNGQWLEGTMILQEWDEFYIIGKTGLEYYGFYWMTTA